ncbi:MAG: hypothetical protein ABWX83_06755 [Luteibacter sp.]
MGNVIDFLARVGQDASLRHANGAVLDEALDALAVGQSARDALIAKDSDALRASLGLGVFFGSQMPDGPDHEEKEDEDEDDGDNEDDGDDADDKPTKPKRSSGLSH